MSKKKKVLLPVVGSLAGLSLASIGGAWGMMKTYTREKHEIDVYDDCRPSYNYVTEHYASELWSFTSFDGLKLKAHCFTASPDAHIYAIVVHGYHGQYVDMMPYAQHYLEKGYNVLMPHLRGHGLSEGDYVGFGYHDHYDICGWIDLLRERDPHCQIIIHGMSMGSATVMLCAGEYLPTNVKCCIADCGFTDAYEQCAYSLKKMYKVPSFPAMNLMDHMMQVRYKYSLHDSLPINAVAHATIPICFIHGDKDDFVPFYMQKELYDACTSEKDMLVVEGAGHVKSVYVAPDKFWGKVDEFIGTYVG